MLSFILVLMDTINSTLNSPKSHHHNLTLPFSHSRQITQSFGCVWALSYSTCHPSPFHLAVDLYWLLFLLLWCSSSCNPSIWLIQSSPIFIDLESPSCHCSRVALLPPQCSLSYGLLNISYYPSRISSDLQATESVTSATPSNKLSKLHVCPCKSLYTQTHTSNIHGNV